MSKKLALSILVVLIFFAGCNYYREANKQAVERLNNQFKQENYDEMYQQSSDILKSSISKEEFISVVKDIRGKMKDVDENFAWQEDKNAHFDEAVFRDDNFSYRIMSKNERKLEIQIEWNTPFQLCSIEVFQNLNESSGKGFRYCD